MGGWGSNSYNKSKSSFNENVWGGQSPWLQNMYADNKSVFDNTNYEMLNPVFDRVGNQMNTDMQMVYPGLENQISGGFRDPRLEQSLYESMENPSAMGRMYESIVGGPGNTYIDPIINDMKTSAMSDLRRGGLRNLDAGYASHGRAGSDRNAIEAGMMKADTMNNVRMQENALRGGAYDKDLQWKMDIAKQADLGRGQAQDRAMDLLAGRNTSQRGGMSYMPSMQQLAMGQMAPYMTQFMMPWDVMSMYAGNIGSPVMERSGSSSGMGFNMSGGGGITG